VFPIGFWTSLGRPSASLSVASIGPARRGRVDLRSGRVTTVMRAIEQTVQTVGRLRNMAARHPELTRERLLAAARREALEAGSAMSLASVAKRAGVSKGGLLHHFRTKDALLLALTLEIVEEFRSRLDEYVAAEQAALGPTEGAWMRGYIEVSFAMSDDFDALYSAAGALDPDDDIRQAILGAQRFIVERCEQDGLPAGRAHAVRCACDGALLARRAWLPELDERRRSQMIEELLSWTRR
jgi:AcrR family transcriptional regulator